jgi:hypothetical protein
MFGFSTCETSRSLFLRLRHIDMDLERLRLQRPRTDLVWQAIDFRLDQRIEKCAAFRAKKDGI